MAEIDHGDPLIPRRSRLSDAGRFQTVQLNVAGWGALLGAGSAVAAATAWLTRAPLAAALGGGLVGAWAIARGLDHRRWHNSDVVIGLEDVPLGSWPEIVRRLQAEGISASLRETIDEDGGDIRWSIECRQADADAVTRAIHEAAPPVSSRPSRPV